MNIYVATEQRFLSHAGRFYAEAVAGGDFWERYLDVFHSVYVVARVQPIDILPPSSIKIDHPSIQIIPIPNYVSWRGLFHLPQILKITRQISRNQGVFILRVPSVVGACLTYWLQKRKHPYGLEVVGDPYDSLSPVALGFKWVEIARRLATAQLKKQCKNAAGVAYVTREALQKRYPPDKTAYSTYYSDVQIQNFAQNIYQSRRVNEPQNKKARLIFVGSLSQRYKGLHDLLEAVHICQTEGVFFDLEILGDGVYRTEYENLAQARQLQEVYFQGYIPQGTAVSERLAQADLFVMPSLVEGLPRAMIEAMAHGLPCLGTKIGGIPELLAPEDLVPRGNPPALAKKIIEVLSNPEQMQQMSGRNFQASLVYQEDALRQKRRAFYQHMHDTTAKVIPRE